MYMYIMWSCVCVPELVYMDGSLVLQLGTLPNALVHTDSKMIYLLTSTLLRRRVYVCKHIYTHCRYIYIVVIYVHHWARPMLERPICHHTVRISDGFNWVYVCICIYTYWYYVICYCIPGTRYYTGTMGDLYTEVTIPQCARLTGNSQWCKVSLYYALPIQLKTGTKDYVIQS